MNKLVVSVSVLLGVILLVWPIIIPLWQAPDEQAHFAQLQWYAENKNTSVNSKENLSFEVATSEELLGTRRDGQGNNKFTYHPEYKIQYSSTKEGVYEREINSQPIESRTTYVDREAAGYPPLYYLLSLPFYNAVYNHGLIDRVFAGRLLPIILHLLLFLIAYKVGREVWKEKVYALALGVMVAFQPMVSFVGAGIHPDNLLNLIYSAGILVCFLVLKNGVKLSYLVVLGGLGVLGVETKQLMFFFFPVAGAVVVYKFLATRSLGRLGILGGLGILASPVVAFIFQLPLPYMTSVTASSPLGAMGFLEYLKFRVPRLVFEMWPWFWGVFKWLGVTLPPLVLKVITRVGIVAGVGIAVRGVRELRDMGKDKNFETTAVIFCLISVISYITYLFFWDWRLMQSMGYSQGLQGRYLFPNIIPIMIIILIGVKEVFRTVKLEKPAVIILGIGMVVLNFIALYLVANSYYDLSSWSTFTTELAQYKPGIIKAIL